MSIRPHAHEKGATGTANAQETYAAWTSTYAQVSFALEGNMCAHRQRGADRRLERARASDVIRSMSGLCLVHTLYALGVHTVVVKVFLGVGLR